MILLSGESLLVLALQARSEAMQAQLDTTLAQLQEMKLQKLELEKKLQQRAQTSSLTGQVQSAVFAALQ